MAVTAVKEKLVKVQWLGVTSDLWTSISQHAYLSLTAHCVNEAGGLETCLLDCVELADDDHAAADIAREMDNKFAFWGLKAEDGSLKVHAGVCDNGQNTVNALTDHLKIPLEIGCVSHTVNLCDDEGFKMQSPEIYVLQLTVVILSIRVETFVRYERCLVVRACQMGLAQGRSIIDQSNPSEKLPWYTMVLPLYTIVYYGTARLQHGTTMVVP